MFCADHCNQWVTKSTFYRHQALCVAERKKESNDEDSTDDILENILNQPGAASGITEQDEERDESDDDSINDVLDGITNDMESPDSPRAIVEPLEPDPNCNSYEDIEESWLIEVANYKYSYTIAYKLSK